MVLVELALSLTICDLVLRPLKNYFISEKTWFCDAIRHDGSVKDRVIQRSLLTIVRAFEGTASASDSHVLEVRLLLSYAFSCS
jgi:membrane-associated PAP2 superfamily phosphatase